jgi:flagellar secretion chaperone FliS
MSPLHTYQTQKLQGGWTRAEMLLQVYDHAIVCIERCQAALRDNQPASYSKHLLKAYKAILALHSGLKAEEDEVAFNIARLLHFAIVCIEKKELEPALKILRDLRDSFAAIADQANELEAQGIIEPMPAEDTFTSHA